MMKTKIHIGQYLLICLIGFLSFGCIDNEPKTEDLPSPDVAFTYEVIDETYQLDYYVGATVEFTSASKLQGECTWDFGDGSATVDGNAATHKFTVAGAYHVKLTVAGKYKMQPILIKDIVPIMSVDPIEDGVCEVLTTPVSISVELPNPENLQEDFLWIFPQGTTDEDGNAVATSTQRNPGKLQFGHVGSQTVRLQVKLGGRPLEEGRVNVPVAYNEEVPTLYYAVKGGNIMALKLVNNKPAGMNINPFDMAVSSGKHPLNILFNDTSLYILDCGQQFTYVDDENGNLGDGRITVMAKDGSKVETMLTNTGAAFDDPFYGCIEDGNLYFSDRLTGFTKIAPDTRNKIYSLADYPFYVEGTLLGYYGRGMTFSSLNAGIGKINGTWYWCKAYGGSGIYRFTDNDILKEYNNGTAPVPGSGVVLEGTDPKAFVWDGKNKVFYFTLFGAGKEGLYRCTLDQLNAIGPVSEAKLAPYRLKTANGKSVTPIIETGKGEGSTGEFIGICQLALDEATGCVYFGLRSAYPNEVKSGLMRYNPAKGIIEHVIEGVEVYGVAVNNSKSKLF
jgi:PKD repeat protein